VLRDRWCIHPDFPDAEIAAYTDAGKLSAELGFLVIDQCDSLISAHKHMLAAVGKGSFPASCYPDLYPNNHAVRVYLELDTFKPIHTRTVKESELEQILRAGVWRMTREQVWDTWSGKPMILVAMDLCNESYRRRGCAPIMADDGPNGSHNIHILSKYIAGATIGYAYFNNGTCGNHVNNFIDNSWDGGLMGLARLLTHECGHNHDLPHTFNGQSRHHGVMGYDPPPTGLFYGYSDGEAPHVLPRDPSLDQLIRQYGNEEVPPIDGPVIPTPTVPPFDGLIYGEEFEEDKFAIRGTFVATRDIKQGETFSIKPGTVDGTYLVRVKPRV